MHKTALSPLLCCPAMLASQQQKLSLLLIGTSALRFANCLLVSVTETPSWVWAPYLIIPSGRFFSTVVWYSQSVTSLSHFVSSGQLLECTWKWQSQKKLPSFDSYLPITAECFILLAILGEGQSITVCFPGGRTEPWNSSRVPTWPWQNCYFTNLCTVRQDVLPQRGENWFGVVRKKHSSGVRDVVQQVSYLLCTRLTLIQSPVTLYIPRSPTRSVEPEISPEHHQVCPQTKQLKMYNCNKNMCVPQSSALPQNVS